MFINTALNRIQNSRTAEFFADSLIFKNIDSILFILLLAVIISTAFCSTGTIGAFSCLFFLFSFFKIIIKKGECVRLAFINKILIIYLLFVVISLAGAAFFALSLKGILKTLIYIAFYFGAVYFLSQNKRKIYPVLLTILLTVSIEAIIGILQNISHVEAIATWQDSSNADAVKLISRAYGTLKPYNPNLLAGYLVAGISSIFTFLSLAFLKKNKTYIFLFGLIFLTTIYAIFVTGSRGGYLGIFGIFLLILVFAFNLSKKAFAITGGIGTACFLALCLIPSFLNRIISIFSFRGDSSISFRMNVYKACYQMFLDNKFLGTGVGNKNFREIYGLYMKTGFDALGAYSVPLEILVESGIFALAAFFAFIILIFKRSVDFIKSKLPSLSSKIVIFGVLLTITGTMFHGLFDTVFFRPQIQILFWINIAVFNAIVKTE